MPLAPEIETLLVAFNALPPMHQVPILQLRKTRERLGATGGQAVGAVLDRTIPGPAGPLGLRLYAPEGAVGAVGAEGAGGAEGADDAQGAKRDTGLLPLVLFFHGGGFVFGSVEGYYDYVCRFICAHANCRVISVAYRLAPEDKFPAATDDCYSALQWAAQHAGELGVDSARVFVAGGSAGANLAAVTALRARDTSGPALCGQLLFYPLTDYHTPASASSLAYANGYYLTRADVIWFWQQYLRSEADARNPYAAPSQAQTLAKLPPALIITAEFDPLRDEGEQYAHRLREDGVPVTLSRYAGMVHGFLAFPAGQAALALQEAVQWIKSSALGLKPQPPVRAPSSAD